MRHFHQILAAMLIAILATGATSAPALRHTHAMSDHSHPSGDVAASAHDHSHGHRHRHVHSHGDQHSGGDHDHDIAQGYGTETQSTFGESPVDHMHVSLFGFWLTLPVSSDGTSDSTDASVGEWVPLLGELVSPHVTASSAEQSLDPCIDMGWLSTAVTSPRAEPFVPPKLSLLCDTARRECAGVLNI